MDTQVAWSWDLVNWTRPPQREPFISKGFTGEFDSQMIYTAQAPVLIGGKLYFYYGGFDVPHNSRQFNGAIGIATLRLDGFCSMHADDDGGWLITRRERVDVPEIMINAATGKDGYVKAEILDLQGNIIPGFSMQDCIPFTGDSIGHKLKWKTDQSPKDQEKTVKKIRFYLKNADIYSYIPIYV